MYDPMQIIGWSAGWKGVALRSAITLLAPSMTVGVLAACDSRHVSFALPSRTHHGSSHQGTSRFPIMICLELFFPSLPHYAGACPS